MILMGGVLAWAYQVDPTSRLHRRPTRVRGHARDRRPCADEFVLCKRRVSADTALRLGRDFDTTPQFWLGLQTDYGLDVVSDELGDRLDRELRPPRARR